jgi:hypothetical protein
MSGRVVWLVCLLIVVLCGDARGQKVDVIRLRNGDRITCEVSELSHGTLAVSTDPFGKVSVYWGQIENIESPRAFDLQLASGERYFGALAAAAPNQLTIALGGGLSVTVALVDVVQLAPIGRSFWRRVDGSLDVGFSFAQANLETRGTANGSMRYRSRRYQLRAGFSSQVITREDAEREYRTDLNLSAGRDLWNHWYALTWGAFQQNDELSLNLRLVGGLGIGHELVHTNRRLWAIYAGPAFTREHYAVEPVEQSIEAAVGGQLDFFTSGSDDLNFTNRLISYVHLGGRRRVRLEWDSAWRHEFLEDFYWSFNGFENFDSDPPDDQKQNDVGVSFSIGWKF